MKRELMKGNEALAEAAVRAGCRFFAGYPITPQSEIVEYMSWRVPEAGGSFVQSESELAGISMVYGAAAAGFRSMTSSSGPGFSLLHEGISYISSAELPAVIVDVMRYGTGLGDIFQGQADYWQGVKGGGHGDYRLLVLAPASVQESADLIALAFDKAEEYMNPVLILSDASIGQMMEPVSLPDLKGHDPDQFQWSLKGKQGGDFRRVTSTMYYRTDFNEYIKAKFDRIAENEERWESVSTEDAEVIMVAYGISSRIAKEAVRLGREAGLKLGLIRPISLWPFPKKAFTGFSENLRGFLTVEMSSLGQMGEDVALADRMRHPVYAYLSGDKVPDPETLVATARRVLAGEMKEAV
ncbi:3-methyl-2-oxobutanoate dehydrogenase subunit beta [Deltaproteobacteria bacterium Smac51]|nr:3-methyl-2-oxobutanoate dehydrogenase subunit beta [Deltaproteobacteria bacterium Smac51]